MSAPPLGTAANFAVLAGSTVTNTGPTLIIGPGNDVGVSPGSATPGVIPGVTNPGGTIHAADAVAAQAQVDLTAAFTNAMLQPTGTDLTGQDLGGLTLTPGVYGFATSGALTGTLTLDAQGDPSAVFIFKFGTTLTTAAGPGASRVLLINGASSCNVYWAVGSSATIGTFSEFAGIVMADQSITVNTSATVSGRLLARIAAVTLDSNLVNTACVVCFVKGTGILTTKGYVRVEDLKVGDDAITVTGGRQVAKPITWIGRLRLQDLQSKPVARPICIRKDALAPNVPLKDVFVSPQHGIFIKGKLFLARLLVNGGTIFQDARFDAVDYYHVELAEHHILVADGLCSESFLDTGCRFMFDNGNQVESSEPRTWEHDACAPLIQTEEKARAIHGMLALRSRKLGHAPVRVARRKLDRPTR